MTFSLPHDVQSYVDHQVEMGYFPTGEAVIEAAIREVQRHLPTTTTLLPDELQWAQSLAPSDFVEYFVSLGFVRSIDELALSAVLRLQSTDEHYNDWLRRELAVALDQSNRGGGIDSEEFFRELAQEFPGIFDDEDDDSEAIDSLATGN
jgi:Arc/MetJ-type ribon-helix-helix transcriptional regulator